LYNLAEVRFFLTFIDERLGDDSVIGTALWEAAKKALQDAYEGSDCMNNCQNMIQAFEATCRIKYRTDLEEFIRESSYEDFYESSEEYIFVSTIHKAKGREFDTVFLMLKNCFPRGDEEKRSVYVALTRAKNALYIHCNTALFDHYELPGVKYRTDPIEYEAPEEILLQLSYRDIYLDYFKNRQNAVSKLRSGYPLTDAGDYLTAEIEERTVRIGRFSKAFCEKMDVLKSKGYVVSRAKVGFVVLWKGEDDKEESFIVLPMLYFKRKKDVISDGV
jgi:ATP-dependent DNA helicase RecQ